MNKRLNAKKIAAVVTGAALLGFGLVFASPVTYSNVPVINNAGQPVVQVVVGHAAQPSDGVAAGNIAAAIGNLAFTQTTKVFPVNATQAQSVLGVSVSPANYQLTNQKVFLNVSSSSLSSGSFGFTGLIGSVLNGAVLLSSPISTKSLQGATYGYPESNSVTASPAASVYYAAGGVPVSSVTGSYNGGGVSFTTFTTTAGSPSVNYDNIMRIDSSELPALMNNWGSLGENEYLWITGFPVYDQASSVKQLALLSAGGAYQVTFNKPIPQHTSSNGINNANFQLLGQGWSIINSNTVGVGDVSSTSVIAGGKMQLASSLTNLTTVYVGGNLTSGDFRVQLSGIGNMNSNGQASAAINLYYQNSTSPVNTSVLASGTLTKFNVSGHIVYIKVNSTFAGGSFAYQQFAKLKLYANAYNITSGQVFNQTNNPGWYVDLLWTNGTGTGIPNELQSIVLYNTTPTTLYQGQSFSYIHSPAAYKLQFVGTTLGSTSFDHITATVAAPSSVQYQNNPVSTTYAGNINNITEPTQELLVSSQIPNAFSFAGQTAQNLVYNLVPYRLVEQANSIGVANSVANAMVTLTYAHTTQNALVTSNSVLAVTVYGARSAGAGVTQLGTATFSSPTTVSYDLMVANVYNVTGIKLNKAIPGLTVSVSENSVVMAMLQPLTTPQLLYTQTGKNYLINASGSAVIYNQQNGQPTTLFSITQSLPSGTGSQSYGTYTINEINVPSQTSSQDSLAFGIYNATAGTGANPLFILNQSTGGTHNNMTYVSSSAQSLQVPVGFVTERGSNVASISPSSVTVAIAESVNQMQFAIGPTNVTAVRYANNQYNFSVGQQVSIPGLTSNVTVAKVTASVNAVSNGTTISGLSNLTSSPVVVTTPVLLNNLPTTPLVVLDSATNPQDTLILVGSGYVNALSGTMQSQMNVSNTALDVNGGKILTSGNQILVAGWTANETTAAANRFIQALYQSAASS